MLSQALSVFDFLKIKYPKRSESITLYIIPCLIGCVGVALSIYLKNHGIILFTHERFSDVFAFLAVLPGFYIASLAAISAISRIAIDEIIDKDSKPPYILKCEPNQLKTYYKQPLTRRLFLSMLFAYLSSISLILTIVLISMRFYFSISAVPSISLLMLCYFIGFFLFAQILLLTFVGVGYLGYKSLANN